MAIAAVEMEREPQWLEISPEVLLKYGWELYQRTDGHVFTVLVKQGTDVEEALWGGKGVYTRHQLKSTQGALLPGSHIDLLDKKRQQVQGIMDTVYSPSIGHQSYTVLVRKD